MVDPVDDKSPSLLNEDGYEHANGDKRTSMDLESVLKQVGDFGRFQIMMGIVCHSSGVAAAITLVLVVFTAAEPAWQCHDMREHYDVTITGNTSSNNGWWSNGHSNMTLDNATCQPTGTCYNITFDDEFTSIISEWGLVCDRKWLNGLLTTVQMVGFMVGVFISGHLSDIFGRKKSFFLIYASLLVFTVITAFSVNLEMYGVFRFCCGMAAGGIIVINYVIPSEVVGVRYRTFINILNCPLFGTGLAVLALLGYFVRDWRTLTLVSAAVSTPYLALWWFIPESVRWLLIHGRFEESKDILNRIARFNGKPPPDLGQLERNMKQYMEKSRTVATPTVVDLFRSRKYAKITMMLAVLWFTCGCVYYGLTFGVKNLSGDRYINLILIGIIDIPTIFAYPISYVEKIGRRYATILFFVLATITTFAVPILHWAGIEITNAISPLNMTSKYLANMAFTTVYIFTTETYPTVIRSVGLGTCSTAARIGAILSPLIIELHDISVVVPYVIFGSLLVVAMVCTFFIGETRDKQMEDYLPSRHKEKNRKPNDPIEGDEMKPLDII